MKPELSACLNGVSEKVAHERPITTKSLKLDRYGERWFPFTGLTLHSFLHDPPWLQAIKRLVNYPVYLARKSVQQLLASLRAWVKAGLKAWIPVLSRVANNAWRSGGKWR